MIVLPAKREKTYTMTQLGPPVGGVKQVAVFWDGPHWRAVTVAVCACIPPDSQYVYVNACSLEAHGEERAIDA